MTRANKTHCRIKIKNKNHKKSVLVKKKNFQVNIFKFCQRMEHTHVNQSSEI